MTDKWEASKQTNFSPIAKDVRKSITDVHNLLDSDQDASLFNRKDIIEVKRENGPDSASLLSDGFIREENSLKEQSQEVDRLKYEHFKDNPDTRLFVPLTINEINPTKPDYCDRSHSPEDKEFHVLSLRKKPKKAGDNEIKPEMRKGSEHSFENCIETEEHKLCHSPSSSEDEYSDKSECSYKIYKDSGKQLCSMVSEDGYLSGRLHHGSFSEESLSFSQTEGTSHHPCLTLNESQKVQKELYKAQMGTLEFSNFTSDL